MQWERALRANWMCVKITPSRRQDLLEWVAPPLSVHGDGLSGDNCFPLLGVGRFSSRACFRGFS